MSALELPEVRAAHEPPEVSGQGRDDVAMLVACRGDNSLRHTRFRELPEVLEAGDLLVVNTSATLPAAVPARLCGRPLELRLSTPASAGTWVIELRDERGSPAQPPPAGTRLELPGGAYAELLGAFAASERLSRARLALGGPLEEYLDRHGHPIRYGYVTRRWPLEAYQTVFAREPGSAEMPSAGRPFTTELVTELVAGGILIAPIVLHAGVSSLERGERPYPERFQIPEATARVVNAVRGWHGRVIAVGTTVVRALETTARPDRTVAAGRGFTDLVVSATTRIRSVDGLLTGWHEPHASHLELLEALAGAELVERSYREARARGYRWHEFGDLHLILAGETPCSGRPAGATEHALTGPSRPPTLLTRPGEREAAPGAGAHCRAPHASPDPRIPRRPSEEPR